MFVALAQTWAEPVIEPAAAGKAFTVMFNGGEILLFPQILLAQAVIGPFWAFTAKLIVMELVYIPETMMAPEGTAQS